MTRTSKPRLDMSGSVVTSVPASTNLSFRVPIGNKLWKGLAIKLYLVTRSVGVTYEADVLQTGQLVMRFTFDPPVSGQFGSALVASSSPIDLADIMYQVCNNIIRAIENARNGQPEAECSQDADFDDSNIETDDSGQN